MRGISTFGAFTTARLGIYAAQKALDVTGHNITNINTPGYTRQRLDQMSLRTGGTDRYSSSYDTLVGSGVLCTGVSQLRDPYLDIRYRNEQASVGAMDAKLAGLEELSSILDEVTKGDGSGIMEAQFNDLVTQLQNLSKHTGQEEFDSLVRSSAYSLVKLFNNYADQLKTVKENQVVGFKQDIDTVNSILTNIRDLNSSILSSELSGNPALELKDQRNLLIDELSKYIKINVEYKSVSVGAGQTLDKLVLSLAGTTDGGTESRSVLVDGNYARQLSIHQELGKDSANYDLDLSALTDYKSRKLDSADIGVNLGDLDLYGSLQATREILTEAGEFTLESVVVGSDPNAVTKRGIPYYQNALDSLARKFATVLNEANSGYLMDSQGNYVKADGQPITYVDGSGNTVNLTKDTDLDSDPALKTKLETEGKSLGGILFSNSSDSNVDTDITASNISISKSWSIGDIRILNSKVMGSIDGETNSTDNSNIIHIIALMDSDQSYKPSDVVPNAFEKDTPFFNGSFQEMLTNISGTLASDMSSTSTLLNNYVYSANEINTNRDAVSGVDLNDEATSLMQYQKSYAAACRLMTTLDEALDKLINGTGVVGR